MYEKRLTDLTRRRPSAPGARGDRVGGIVEIAVPVTMLDQLPALAADHPEWARVLHGICGSWAHREQARAALDQHPHRRFAHAALRRHVQMRDRHCVGVGCRRRAATADLDHTRDHAHGGPTVTTNSGPHCARHHTMKHQGGWTLTQSKAGHFVWTSPLGQTYPTRGEPITPDLPQPLPRDADPDPPGVPMTWEAPIFCPPEPPPPPARPPPTELPDQPPF
ncbi:MAG: HNH endonuclease signature motif containing protein [Pseudonocardiaceae bacterium]